MDVTKEVLERLNIKRAILFERTQGVGYTTDFEGSFYITPTLKPEDRKYLVAFANTRRMKRNLGPVYGVEGEFYVEGTGFAGQDEDLNIIDYNRPPSTQPGLWCQWEPNEDGTTFGWNGTEKFYNYVEWLAYLISNIFIPRGYTLNGEVEWIGEDSNDFGKIQVVGNAIRVAEGMKSYEKWKDIPL